MCELYSGLGSTLCRLSSVVKSSFSCSGTLVKVFSYEQGFSTQASVLLIFQTILLSVVSPDIQQWIPLLREKIPTAT